MTAPEPRRRPPEDGRDTTQSAAPAPRPPSQRGLVTASLLRCPRGEAEFRHGRPAPRSRLPDH